MDIEAFIFDVDGVLTDTVELHYRSWVQLGEEEGIEFTREINEQMRGLTRPASLKLFLGGREVSSELAQGYLRRKNEYFLEQLSALDEGALLPGVLPLMRELRDAGIKIGIGSASKNAREVVRRLGLESYIDAYSDGHVVERSKPAPDVFLAAARLLGVPPETCVVVEDAEAGVQAARAAGMRVIGVGQSSQNSPANLWCSSLEDISLGLVEASLSRDEPAQGGSGAALPAPNAEGP